LQQHDQLDEKQSRPECVGLDNARMAPECMRDGQGDCSDAEAT